MQQPIDYGAHRFSAGERQHESAEVVLAFEGVIVLRAGIRRSRREPFAQFAEMVDAIVRMSMVFEDPAQHGIELDTERLKFAEHGHGREPSFRLQIAEQHPHRRGVDGTGAAIGSIDFRHSVAKAPHRHVPIVRAAHRVEAPPPQSVAQLGIAQQRRQLGVQVGGVVRLREHEVYAVDPVVRDAVGTRRHDGQSTGERFQRRESQTFVPGRAAVDVARGHDVRYLAVGRTVVQLDRKRQISEAPAPALLLRDEHKLHRHVRAKPPQRLETVLHAFVGHQIVADHQHARRRCEDVRRTWTEDRLVDAHRHVDRILPEPLFDEAHRPEVAMAQRR
jgi:hypothetical protein